MPNFAVNGSTPALISQALTESALLRNTGNSAVFLDAYSSVTSSAYGLELQPFDSVSWAQGRDLYAVCAPGESSSLSVLYGAEGVSLGSVSAVVTGDVTATIDGPIDAVVTGSVEVTSGTINAEITGDVVITSGQVNVGGILTPVQVQGGGEVLLDQSGTINPGVTLSINIPAPASGLTYAGIGIIVEVTSKSVVNAVPLMCYLYNNGSTIGSPAIFQAAIITTALGEFGAVRKTKLVAPVGSAFPLELELENNGASGIQGYRVIAVGLSYADTLVRDFGQWESGAEIEINFDNVSANAHAVIAASYETRQYLLVSASGSVGNFNLDVLSVTGTWSASQLRLQNTVYGNITPTSEVQPNVNALITVPGDGRVHRVRTGNAVTGFVRLSYIGKIT